MPDYELYDSVGNVVQRHQQSSQERAAEDDAIKTMRIDALDLVALRALFNHENRIRALARAVRQAALAAANAQGVEPARADMTLDEFKAAIKALL